MANPLSSMFGQGPQQNNMLGLIGQFQEFKNNFKGNPEQVVQELRRSGKMSEAQFQQLSALATQFQKMMR